MFSTAKLRRLFRRTKEKGWKVSKDKKRCCKHLWLLFMPISHQTEGWKFTIYCCGCCFFFHFLFIFLFIFFSFSFSFSFSFYDIFTGFSQRAK